MKKRLLSILILCTMITALPAQEGPKKEAITIKDINGTSYTVKGTSKGLDISGMEGKVVIIEFFGHECPPCLMSIPNLIEMKNRHKDKLGIFAVELQGLSNEQLKLFAKDIRPFKQIVKQYAYRVGADPMKLMAPIEKHYTINYPVFSEEVGENAYFVAYLARRAQWRDGIPFTIMLDTTGEVKYVHPGFIPMEILEKLFDELSQPTPKKQAETKPISAAQPTRSL